MLQLRSVIDEIRGASALNVLGKVSAVRGQTVTAKLPSAAIGDLCYIECGLKKSAVRAEVISLNEHEVTLACFDHTDGLSSGAEVRNTRRPLELLLQADPRGSILNALGEPLEGPARDHTLNCGTYSLPLRRNAPAALSRKPIDAALQTGIRAIDTCCTLGYGQRVGLFASAGLGKSTLLGMLTRNAAVDVTVIALVGERGREVNEFLEESLGVEGRKRAVVIVATSDEPSIRRTLAPLTATAIAEHYRAQGKRVLLLIDSLTRYARALREVTLAAGELPVRQGYTPSVYTELPRLLERAGNDHYGSISAIYTVLTETHGELDPLGDEIKSILDGHLVLTSEMVQQGIRPAIDLTQSLSRLMTKFVTPQEMQQRSLVAQIFARLRRERDILLLGGTPDKALQAMLTIEPQLRRFLSQSISEVVDPVESLTELQKILKQYGEM
jgi:FliI/YscN family ATPase